VSEAQRVVGHGVQLGLLTRINGHGDGERQWSGGELIGRRRVNILVSLGRLVDFGRDGSKGRVGDHLHEQSR
jgi:hypothetical protein